MTHNLPHKLYKGLFNYQGYVWEGETRATNENHAFSKLVVGMAKKCSVAPYRMRNYFLERRQQWEVKCQS